MSDADGKFYLGRLYDPQGGVTTDQPLFLDPDDLTTHAFVVGMTGSGKTGLCIGLLEEAALQGLPALMIDPKGDITNTLLHFPELRPEDFTPWVNPDAARREGKTIAETGQAAAESWRKGLAQWDITPERLQALKESAQFAVFTPGSDAGLPVSILASLEVPPIRWEENRELLREKISSTVTALLGLVGVSNIDPVRSREHILLANIFEHAWSQGRSLDLGELILQTQSPPFEKLGVFDINMFFPQKERFELAMLLNNILAAPAFQTWIEGQPLDIPSLLYTPDGRPRHSVFYIAHLSDAERMFFVTLLYGAVESWMRTQSGATSLRALLYFDEIFGYLPPVSNPPSKEPILRMLKQARAFGVGQVLVTQNPVDVDYKALSNAGVWYIGKLQTDQDKQRLLDGLQGAAGAGMDRQAYDRLISTLGKRVFLLHNVHAKEPKLFSTRWAMNYLAGPLTRSQIPALNELAQAGEVQPQAAPARAAARAQQAASPIAPAAAIAAAAPTVPTRPADAQPGGALPGSATRQAPPAGVNEVFLPTDLTLPEAYRAAGKTMPVDAAPVGVFYRPGLLAQAEVRFLQRKYNLDHEIRRAFLISEPDRRGVVRWEEHNIPPLEPDDLHTAPGAQARFAALEAPLTDARLMKSLASDFTDWAYHNLRVAVRANEDLRVYAGPDVPADKFRQMCAEAARAGRDRESEKVQAGYAKKLASLQDKLAREQRALEKDQDALSQRKLDEFGTHAETLLGLFGKRRRRLSTSMNKRRMTAKAQSEVKDSQKTIEELKRLIRELEKAREQELAALDAQWVKTANQVSEIPVTPYKKDIQVALFGVVWIPYYLVRAAERVLELPAFVAARPPRAV